MIKIKNYYIIKSKFYNCSAFNIPSSFFSSSFSLSFTEFCVFKILLLFFCLSNSILYFLLLSISSFDLKLCCLYRLLIGSKILLLLYISNSFFKLIFSYCCLCIVSLQIFFFFFTHIYLCF